VHGGEKGFPFIGAGEAVGACQHRLEGREEELRGGAQHVTGGRHGGEFGRALAGAVAWGSTSPGCSGRGSRMMVQALGA
jgi:hypothetical protein